MRPEFVADLTQRYGRMNRILWLAMTAAPILFLVVAWIQTSDPAFRPADAGSLLPSVLAALGLSLVAIAVVVRRAMATPDRLLAGATTATPKNEPPGMMLPESDGERRLASAAKRYQFALILTLAIAEFGAVVGFVATILSGNIEFVATCVALIIVADVLALRPRDDIFKTVSAEIQLGR